MCHGFGQKNRILPLTRSRKQLPLPQFSSTLILASLQKDVEMPLHKDLALYSHKKTPCHLCKAGSYTGWSALLTNRKGALGSSVWPRTQPSVHLWQKSFFFCTEHKPLVSISKKAISLCTKASTEIPPPLTAVWCRNKIQAWNRDYLEDTLSRAYQSLSPTDTRRSETESPEVESIHAVDYLGISEQQLSEIKQETAKDPNLQTLKNLILRGWPENGSSVPKEVSEYLNVREKLAVQDGIILKGQRCVIPQTLRQKVNWNRGMPEKSTWSLLLAFYELKNHWLHWTMW